MLKPSVLLNSLPIMLFFSISTFATNVTTLLRSCLVAMTAFILLAIDPLDLKKYKFLVILFSGIVSCFIISFVINEQNYSNFLIGTYGRNEGILALVGLYLLFLQSAKNYANSVKKFIMSLYILLGLSFAYGVIQKINLDPINWEKGAGLGATVGNPNYYGALLGILSIIPLWYAYNTKGRNKYLHQIMYALIFIQTMVIGGSQGYVIFAFSLALFFTLKFKEKIFIRYNMLLILLLGFTLSLLLTLTNIIANLAPSLNSYLQVGSRWEHWMLSIRIWKEHFLFGVGIENMSNFSGEFRNQAVRNWGQYTLPDKSHNVFIDYFVTGGLFAGILWMAFVFFVFYRIFFLIKNFDIKKEGEVVHVLSIIWSAWIFQLLFSPSHIVLDTFAMMSGGALIGISEKFMRERKVHGK